MTYKYTIEGKNGKVKGSNSDYNWILTERDAIMKAIFPNFILSEKLNDFELSFMSSLLYVDS